LHNFTVYYSGKLQRRPTCSGERFGSEHENLQGKVYKSF